VLERQEEEVLVISKDMLIGPTQFNYPSQTNTIYPYILHKAFTPKIVSLPSAWDESVLRKSLNTRFLSEAFTADEQQAIPTVTIKAENRPYKNADIDAGKDTQDRIFLLSYSEAMKYMPAPEQRASHPTASLLRARTYWQLALIDSEWLLRHPNATHGGDCCAGFTSEGIFTDYANRAGYIRPSCWIDLSIAKDSVQMPAAPLKYDGLEVGSEMVLGHYEQDGNAANGAEPIRWTVICRDGRHALLLSSEVLEVLKYTSHERATWETSSIRKWANEIFLPAAFSKEEQALLAQRTVSALHAAEGAHTQDKVFLLSKEEMKACLPQQSSRLAPFTVYAAAQAQSGEQWLRSSGKGVRYAHTVYEDGSIDSRPVNWHKALGIRPAVWINLDSLADK